MPVEIPLRLRGIDLRDTSAYDSIHPDLSDLFWMANGGVSLAVVFSDGPPAAAVYEAIDWARRITKLMPGVSVAEAYDELVSIPDIAARASVAAEAVRMWANGKRRSTLRPFPEPRQVVGSGSSGRIMNLYAWREVLSWIREVTGADPDEGIEYLDDVHYADLNNHLTTITADPDWHPIDLQADGTPP